jgi:hypothetical protein
MSDPKNPEADNPESQGSKSHGSAGRTNLPPLRRDPLSDVVLYDDPAPAAGAAQPTSPRSGSSTAPTAAMPASGPGSVVPNSGGRLSSGAPGNASGSTPSATAARTSTPVPIAWRVWPVIDSVWELLGLSAILAIVPLVVWSLSGRTSLTVVCAVATGVVVWRHFVPTICEMNALGVTQRVFRRTRRIPWLSIDRYVVGRRGVFLTSAGAPLELFRGLYLPWGAHREQILASLRYYLPNAEDAS